MLVDLTKPAAYPLTAKLTKESECDLVMKGGITSGDTFGIISDEIEHDNNPIGHGAPKPQPRLQVRPRPIS
jgi:hypothetical protein